MEVGDRLLGRGVDKDINLEVVSILVSFVDLVGAEAVRLLISDELLCVNSRVKFSVFTRFSIGGYVEIAGIIWKTHGKLARCVFRCL